MTSRLEGTTHTLATLGLAVLALGSPVAPVAAQSPTSQDPIVELPGGLPFRLNDNGQIAGAVFVGPDAHAAIYSAGAWRDLGVPVDDQVSVLTDINSFGAAAGWSFVALPPIPPSPFTDNRWRAIWAPEGATSAELLSGLDPDSFAYGINDSGAIVGCFNRYDDEHPDPNHAFLHSNGSVVDLHDQLIAPATPTPFDHTCARGINNAGDVMGYIALLNQSQRGFLLRNGNVKQLVDGGSYIFDPKAINDAGQVVGQGLMDGSLSFHALIFDAATGKISSLGLEGKGASSSRPNDINTRGDVVGVMLVGGAERAFLASGGQVFDLNDMLASGSEWVLKEALALNNQGQIVGRGHLTSSPGVTRYFLLTLTPQQSTALLIQAVQDLLAGGALGSGNANALIVKLQGAIQQLDKGNVGPAVSKIEAFINQVQAFIQSGTLTAEEGQPLIDAARRIIVALTS